MQIFNQEYVMNAQIILIAINVFNNTNNMKMDGYGILELLFLFTMQT